jgi:hypothetical protein
LAFELDGEAEERGSLRARSRLIDRSMIAPSLCCPREQVLATDGLFQTSGADYAVTLRAAPWSRSRDILRDNIADKGVESMLIRAFGSGRECVEAMDFTQRSCFSVASVQCARAIGVPDKCRAHCRKYCRNSTHSACPDKSAEHVRRDLRSLFGTE